MNSYLAKQGDTYFFRRRVPEQIVHRIGKREIYRSLATTSVRLARQRLLYLFQGTETLFAMARSPEVTDDQLAAAAGWFLTARGFYETIKSLQPERLSEMLPPDNNEKQAPDRIQKKAPDIIQDEVDEYISLHPELRTGDERQRARTKQEVFLETIDWFLVQTGFAPTEGPFNRSEIGIHPKRVVQAVNREAERAVRAQLTLHTHTEEPFKRTPRAFAGKRFSEVVETFIMWRQGHGKDDQRKCEGAPWTMQTEAQNRTTYRLFVTIMKDPVLSAVTKDTVYKFRQKLASLPFSHGKNNGKVKLKRTIADELDRKDKRSLPAVKEKTIKRHFSALSQYFKYLVTERYIVSNPFAGQQFKLDQSIRDTWTASDLLSLFKSDEFKKKNWERYGVWHWLPLIALFTGMRLEEIARLRPEHDFHFVAKSSGSDRKYGFLYVTVAGHDGWKPKTPRAERKVPIHTWLIDCGFEDLFRKRIEELKIPEHRKHSIYLFPELQPRGKNGTLTAGFSREFSRLKKKLEFRPELTFHGFRHTFRSQLGNAGVPEPIMDALLGHEDGQRKVQKDYQKFAVELFDKVVHQFVLPVQKDGVPLQSARLSDEAAAIQPNYLDFLLPRSHTVIASPPASDERFWADAGGIATRRETADS